MTRLPKTRMGHRIPQLFVVFVVTVVLSLSGPTSGQQQSQTDVEEGQSALLECRFDPALAAGNPAYYWIRTNKNDKDNVAIEGRALDHNYQLEFNAKEGKYDLRISSATYDRDNGKFECKVKESGTGNDLHMNTVELTVLMRPNPPEVNPVSPTVTEGEKVNLVCSSTGGSPSPDIVWRRSGDSKPAAGNYKAGATKDQESTNTLTLTPEKGDDGSEWTCEVWNRALPEGQKIQKSIQINVNYFPRFKLNPPNPILIEKGSSKSVTCEVDSKPPPTFVRWVRAGEVIANDRTMTIHSNGIEDAGSYFCEASNGLGEPKKTELVVDILFAPIVKVESHRDAEQGAPLTVQCNVTSNPPASTIEWIKESDQYFRQSGPILRFESVKAEDYGSYMCRAVNVIKRSNSDQTIELVGNATVAIRIKHSPGKAFIEPAEPIASEGEPFKMTCQADPPGWPEPTYKWWRDGTNVTLALEQKFTLTAARMNNEGIYFCKATNALGDSSIASVTLKVYEPPRLITQLPPQATRKAGDSDFTINCNARGNPSPRVRWLKNGDTLETDTRYAIDTQDKFEKNYHIVESTLRFSGEERIPANQLTADDRGHYTCQFENEVKQVSTTMQLKVEYPPVAIHPHDKVASDLYETATLECQMSAFPEPHFEWSFNGSALTEQSVGANADKYEWNVTALKDDVLVATLRVHNVQAADLGEYTCVATNTLAQTRAPVRLQRKGPPDSPTHPEAVEVGFDSVMLRWTAGFDGGFVNTTFSVYGNKSGSNDERAWDCQQSNPCNISGLEQQTSYIFYAQAHNFKGSSPFSEKVNFTTKINAEDIPRPFSVVFNKDSGRLDVRVQNTGLELLGQVDLLKDDGSWVAHTETFPVTSGRGSLELQNDKVETVRVSLCLRSNPLKCGPAQEANVDIVMASLSESEIIGIGIGCTLFALLVIVAAIVTCYCYRRGDKDKKLKDYELETANARPKVVTPPAYHGGGGGVINKGIDSSMDTDEGVKNGIYSTGNHMMNGMNGMNGHMTNGGGYAYLDHVDNGNGGGSIDSQDSLWIKATNNLSGDRPYPYEPPPPMGSSYHGGYPENYGHHMHEDLMNQRNRDLLVNGDPYAAVNKPKKRSMDHMDSPYRDVSGLPDPYMVDEEMDKPQHVSLSFDESLESGYSTPNSRSRRVIREIIV